MYVASLVYAHYEQVVAVLREGKDVLCEKPLALNRARREEMAKFAEKMGLLLSVGYMMRYNVYHREIKRVVAEGILGQLVVGRAQLTCRYPPIPSTWRQVKALGGGVLMDMVGDCVGLLEWFLGKAKAVFGFLDAIVHAHEVGDITAVLLKFGKGAQGIIDNYFNIPERAVRDVLEIYETRGAILVENTIGQDGGGNLFLCEEDSTEYDAAQKREELGYRKIQLNFQSRCPVILERLMRSVAGSEEERYRKSVQKLESETRQLLGSYTDLVKKEG
ncbi:MAG: Gfo/Idh/MocA family oxidoreductase [Atribacterota bacterium]